MLRKLRSLRDRAGRRVFAVFGARRYTAKAWSFGQGPLAGAGRIYVDLSVICRADAQTGIQRVVRAVAFLLAQMSADGSDLQFSFVYVHRRNFYIVELHNGEYRLTDQKVNFQAGDIFFGLDYALDSLWHTRRQLLDMRRRGVRFWFLVHDLLPLQQPRWFSGPTVLRFGNWLALLAGLAEGVFCVSAAVERDVRGIMHQRFRRQDSLAVPLKTVVVPMGWDIGASVPSQGLPAGFAAIVQALEAEQTVLMVGTLEPRKGHADLLDAMELLWSSGRRTCLALVGAQGWKTNSLRERLEGHPEAGHRLFVLGKLSDEALCALYQSCAGVIVPSLAEGFGLPVVEALGRGKRVLARDIPVFAEGARSGVTYFPREADAPELAGAIADWLDGLADLEAPEPARLSTWRDTAEAIRRTFSGCFAQQ